MRKGRWRSGLDVSSRWLLCMATESSCTLSAQGFHSAVGAVGAVEWRDARGFAVQMVVLRIFDLSAFP